MDLLILKAREQFKSPVEAVRFLMESGLEKILTGRKLRKRRRQMSNFKKITLYLPNKVSEYLEKLPRGFRRPFLEALILEAQERFTNSEEIAQFVMQHPNLFFKNLYAKESKIDVKEKEKASTCREKGR